MRWTILTAKHPWVHRFAGQRYQAEGGGGRRRPLALDVPLDEEELSAVFSAIAEAKLDIAIAGDSVEYGEAAFVVEPRGG